MRAPLALACAALLALLCSGCAPEWKWRYAPDPPTSRLPLLDNTVAVPNLSDERPPNKEQNVALHLLLVFVPGVLYQTNEVERPEQIPGNEMQFHPTEDVARALADEITNRRLFKATVYSPAGSQGDLILRGRLSSTHGEMTIYQYGLNGVGVYTWFLGIPAGTSKRQLTFTLQLEEPQSESILWQKSYKTERSTTEGLYYGTPAGHIVFDSMLKELMPQILADLEQAIKGMTTAAAGGSRGP